MTEIAEVLLVDDDSDALLSLSRILGSEIKDARLSAVTTAEKAVELFKASRFSVVVLDLSLDDSIGVESGFLLLKQLLQLDADARIIVLTGHGSDEYGIRSLNEGAASFLQKPADIAHLSALVVDGIKQSELQRRYHKLQNQTEANELESTLIGSSEAIQNLREQIQFAATTEQSVLIIGETGTGKGLCAHAIHRLSRRAKFPFVRCTPNFGTSDIVNSDIFGYVKGAFTGAEADKSGLLATASEGTFFLDEVDELPLETQVALLGVLQERVYRPVGATSELPVRIRLLSATNRPLDDCLDQGKLREDFFHRIAHEQIHVPALRERSEDIPELVEHFLLRLHQTAETGIFQAIPSAIEHLQDASWPGNVRQLQGVVEGAAYRAAYQGDAVIRAEHIQLQKRDSPSSDTFDGKTLHDKVEQFKQREAQKAVKESGGNQAQAARALGIDRSTLRRILNK